MAELDIVSRFKRRVPRALNARQLIKAKLAVGAAAAIGCLQVVTAQYSWDDQEYSQMFQHTFPKGRVVEFTNREEFCHR